MNRHYEKRNQVSIPMDCPKEATGMEGSYIPFTSRSGSTGQGLQASTDDIMETEIPMSDYERLKKQLAQHRAEAVKVFSRTRKVLAQYGMATQEPCEPIDDNLPVMTSGEQRNKQVN